MGRDIHALVELVCGGAALASWPLPGEGSPDLTVIDALARLQLAAHRIGCAIRVREASADLLELLSLVGLTDVLAADPVCLRQVGGETEGGEQIGVEEVVVPDDPVA